MYLVIDRGNTRIKIAVFRGDEDPELHVMNSLEATLLMSRLDELESRFGPGEIGPGIYSSVVADDGQIAAMISKRMNLTILSPTTPLPIRNSYGTPETLGNDRIAAAVAASSLFPGTDVLSIDAGTCITFDFINAKAEYLGGAISPGIGIRYRSLNTFTSKLPLISGHGETGLIGDSTEASMRSGVLNGIVAEVDGIIDRYRHLYPGLKIILTGGDANYFDKKLKNNIFAVPNLVLMGLKDILRYNAEN